ncbi:MAG: rhodanese-related sulfurtransferase [Pseudomonadota bacterium]
MIRSDQSELPDEWTVAALYKFVPLPDPPNLQAALNKRCKTLSIFGTLLLANEGINGTVAGAQEAIADLIGWLEARNEIGPLDVKYSTAKAQPFNRMKVRLKREIVTLGVEGIDAARDSGTYVEAADWNDLIAREDVIVVDTRNTYEVELGTFAGAIDPKTESFGELPDWADRALDLPKDTPIAMFCTGGIRCEKSTALMKQRGFENVYHLKGGILKYLEEVPQENSLWEGECFVFDDRVSVRHGLVPGNNRLCHGCRMPIVPEDMEHSHFEEGVSCPRCHGTHTAERLTALRERQKQMQLAKQRGDNHLAVDIEAARKKRRDERAAQRAASHEGKKLWS